MDEFTVTIEREDVERAEKERNPASQRAYNCPIAQALKRTFGPIFLVSRLGAKRGGLPHYWWHDGVFWISVFDLDNYRKRWWEVWKPELVGKKVRFWRDDV